MSLRGSQSEVIEKPLPKGNSAWHALKLLIQPHCGAVPHVPLAHRAVLIQHCATGLEALRNLSFNHSSIAANKLSRSAMD